MLNVEPLETGRLSNIDLSCVPSHVACVMDGNGRWAQSRGLSRVEGHLVGEQALFEIVQAASDIGVKWLTVYAFSTENWRRPQSEVDFLVNFNEDVIRRRCDELHEMGVRVRFIGRRDSRMPAHLIRLIDDAVKVTRNNRGMTLTVAFNYGGRAEIVDAVRELVAEGVSADKITEHAISSRLYDPEMPDPDLMIRTSGEYRTSNFLLWQLAYSELYFTDIAWPDFRSAHLVDAIRVYQNRDRRFGRV